MQLRLIVDRARQRHRIGRVLRHQFAELVDFSIGHLQHAADVAQHAARLQGAEGDDLRHLIAAVAVLHIADHLIAALLAEVDIEVRHRDAFRIEEALEQKLEADRIEIGDLQRIGDERTGAGAAARPDRNALLLRPLDEVGDDQEVAGIFHPFDDAQLEVEPLAVMLQRAVGCEPVGGDAPLQPRLGAAAQFGGFVHRGAIGADGEARQHRRMRARPIGTTLRDLDRGGERFRQIGKQRGHLRAGLEAMLGRELTPVGLNQQAALGDADQRVMRFVVLAPGEERLVGGDQRDIPGISDIEQPRLDLLLRRRAMTLQLDIEPVAEQPQQRLGTRTGQRALACRQRVIERTIRPAGQRNQSIGLAFEPGELHMRRFVRRGFEESARIEPHQAAIAGLARGQ